MMALCGVPRPTGVRVCACQVAVPRHSSCVAGPPAARRAVARGALLTAALIVFVDILKELPATLILRPFDFDTLAVIANNYALDERLGQAGWPSVLIIVLALPPTIWLSRKIAVSRPGS